MKVSEITDELIEGRTAVCLCKKTRPSSDYPNLAFFDYRGVGHGKEDCKNCGYTEVVHQPGGNPMSVSYKRMFPKWPDNCCKVYERTVSWETDIYYCGCRGWD